MPRYLVLLHGKGLRLLDEDGTLVEGGVYTWRVLEADDPGRAGRVAATRLSTEEDLLREIWNPPGEPMEVEVEEVHEATDSAEDSGFVFYCEDDPT